MSSGADHEGYRDFENEYERQRLMNMGFSVKVSGKQVSDGSTASYYELPEGATELQDLISAKNMNYSVGSIFVLCYAHGEAQSVQSRINIVKGIIKHAEYERKRLEAMYPM